MSATLNVSPSILAKVLTCETAAWVRYVKGYTSKGEAIKATAGSAIHAGIAAYLDPRQADLLGSPATQALDAFHRIYDPAFARVDAEFLDPAYTPDNLHRVLARWIEMHPPSALPWRRVLSVEEAFESRSFDVGDTAVRLICRPDIVVEDHNGRVRWVDTKTTGWRISDSGWRRSLRLSLQTQLYTDAVVQRYGDRACWGGWINAIEINKLPTSDGKCKTHVGLTYAECGGEHAKSEFVECLTTPERVTRAVADARDGATCFVYMHGETDAIVSTLAMTGTANGACRFCPAADFCEADRPVAALDQMLHYEPWVVQEGVH